MSHSLIGADRRTHCKIVAVALVAAAVVVGAASSAVQRTEHSEAKATVIKAGKPITVAQTGATIR